MNLPVPILTEQLDFHFLMEENSEGQVVATVAVNPLVEPQRENPWTEFMGMYKDDPVFAEIAAELRAERGLEHLGWVE